MHGADSGRWSAGSIGFHWVMAVLVAVVMALGWIAESYPLSPDKVSLFVWHKSFGLTVLVLLFFRLLNRWNHPAPRHDLRGWERLLGRCVQAALYLCMLAMPLSGWIINSAADFPLNVFWLIPLPPLTGPSEALAELAEEVHITILWIMVGLLALHIAGALRHHFLGRNQVLLSMLPARKSVTPR